MLTFTSLKLKIITGKKNENDNSSKYVQKRQYNRKAVTVEQRLFEKKFNSQWYRPLNAMQFIIF